MSFINWECCFEGMADQCTLQWSVKACQNHLGGGRLWAVPLLLCKLGSSSTPLLVFCCLLYPCQMVNLSLWAENPPFHPDCVRNGWLGKEVRSEQERKEGDQKEKRPKTVWNTPQADCKYYITIYKIVKQYSELVDTIHAPLGLNVCSSFTIWWMYLLPDLKSWTI